ncbi:MAG: phosphoglycerate dehydrogenase [Thermoleophilaceae bacterium]
MSRVAVCSRSFSRHPVLRAELVERYPDTRFNDAGKSLAGDELVEHLAGVEKAITALEKIDDALLDRLPDLRVISKVGVGIDMIDLDALARHGVQLAWSKGTNRRSVSELVLALTLALLRHVVPAANEVRAGGWSQPKGAELSGRAVGIVGFGHVGRDLADLLAPFGCPVLVHDVVEPRDLPPHASVAGSLDELLEESDVVSLHVTLTDETRNLIDASRLALMKTDALLVNTARGGLVDEGALADALREGRLAGAAFDVFATEPPGDVELLSLPSFLATPHIGGSTEEAILAMGRAAIDGLDAARPVEEIPA